MTTSNKQKPREFWIEKFNGRNPASYYAYIEKPERLNMVRIKINDGDPIAASEYFHVIEHSAYAALEAKYSKAVEALEGIDNIVIGGQVAKHIKPELAITIEKRVRETLASLGESEVGEG